MSVIRSGWDERDHPGPIDIVLLIEVADSSLRFDREVKVPLYSRAGIDEVWLVDLTGRAVEVYRQAVGAAGYDAPAFLAPGDRVTVPGSPDVALEVGELLGGH